MAPLDGGPSKPEGATPEDKRLNINGLALPAVAFLLVLPSVLFWVKRRNGGIAIPGSIRRYLERRSELFGGGDDEAEHKWTWVMKCVEELRFSAGDGRMKASTLRRELGRKLSAREVTDAVDYLVDKGDLMEKGDYYVVKEEWKKTS